MAKYRDKRLNEEASGISSYNDLADKPTILSLGETSGTAYRGDRGKTAYDHSQAAHAPSDADNTITTISSAGAGADITTSTIAFLFFNADTQQMETYDLKALRDYFDTRYVAI